MRKIIGNVHHNASIVLIIYMCLSLYLFHNDLSSMIDDYVNDEDYASIMANISNDLPHEPYSLKDGFLLHGSQLCITSNLREKVIYEYHVPPYAGHQGVQATTQAIETYFYWPTMRKDIHTDIKQCIV